MYFKERHFLKINYKLLIIVFVLVFTSVVFIKPASSLTEEQSQYLTCEDFKFVFARGSGAELNSDRDFKPFKAAVDEVFGNSGYSYSFYELGTTQWGNRSYPAPGIGISSWNRFSTSLGAILSGGEAGDYGDSVEDGSDEAMVYAFHMIVKCPDTKIVFAGYSQGAQVISRALQKIKPSWIYAALTFGDPKLYLPEGKMNILTRTTAACRGEEFSEYRAYVPDCYAYQGILGGYKPYQYSSEYSGKLKAYCQLHDIICSSSIDLDKMVSGHATYAEQGTYKRAIEDLYNMVHPSTYTRPAQDVAILFDITGSMEPLLKQFQKEAIAVANRTIKKGGKVALYTYGDLKEVKPVQLCNFETCNSESIENYIKSLTVAGGDDTPESLLSASYTLMRELKWDIGANKSLVVLTDANYHNPDRDGTTQDKVVELSKSIDPVNFYILTDKEFINSYTKLAEQTEGKVYTSDVASAFDDIESEILSRVPATIYTSTDLPEPNPATISNLRLEKTSETSIQLSFDTDGLISFISIDDYLAGYTEEKSISITDLNPDKNIVICVSPVSDTGFRGEPACAQTSELETKPIVHRTIVSDVTELTVPPATEVKTNSLVIIPKAPNTGRQ